jgi:hypothetical protein
VPPVIARAVIDLCDSSDSDGGERTLRRKREEVEEEEEEELPLARHTRGGAHNTGESV